MSEKQDMVNNPPHYTSGRIECIDAMISSQGIEAVKDFCLCNAFKYIWRTKNKNGIEDIDKAIWYLNKYKELTNKNSDFKLSKEQLERIKKYYAQFFK